MRRKKGNVIVDMRAEVQAVNKHLSNVYVQALSPIELIMLMNPMYRETYLMRLKSENLISAEEKENYLRMVREKKMKEKERHSRAYPHDKKKGRNQR